MPKRVEILPKPHAGVYLRRAANLVQTMEWAEGARNADGTATNAVQAAIALGDAFTVFFLGQRSRGQDHHEVIALVARCGSSSAAEVARLLQRVLDKTAEVEYEDRDVKLSDAHFLADKVRRLWAAVSSELD